MASSNKKVKRVQFLMMLGFIFFFLFALNSENPANNIMEDGDKKEIIGFDPDRLKTSQALAKIYINNNWSDAKAAGICTGEGTFSEPYVIRDKMFNGSGYESCILIENSNEYFRIENYTLFESEIGINLYNTSNGIMNNLTFANLNGEDYFSGGTAGGVGAAIYLSGSSNNDKKKN